MCFQPTGNENATSEDQIGIECGLYQRIKDMTQHAENQKGNHCFPI